MKHVLVALALLAIVLAACSPKPRSLCYGNVDCQACERCLDGTCVQDPEQLNACGRCEEEPEEICGDNQDNDCDGETDEGCEDPCYGVTCDTPPGPCHARQGTCTDGICHYPELSDNTSCNDGNDCTLTDRCLAGVCTGTPLVCNNPPDNHCLDTETLRAYTRIGSCIGGICSYGYQDVTCPQGCQQGVCLGDPCAGVVCDDPPGECFRSPGLCHNGVCHYDYLNGAECDDQDACTRGDSCLDGHCAGDPLVCDQPPPNECLDDQTMRSYAANGSCKEGACVYAYQDVSCSQGCQDGLCLGDPCEGVQCDRPPNSCYQQTGTCQAGVCHYAFDDGKVCEDGDVCTVDDRCQSGSCVGIQLTCDSPPDDYCLDQDTLRSYLSIGSCANGVCQYGYQDVTCTFGCQNGYCSGDPCAGVVCDQPPADVCLNSTTLRVYQPTGTCDTGNCYYAYQDVPCQMGCSQGECILSNIVALEVTPAVLQLPEGTSFDYTARATLEDSSEIEVSNYVTWHVGDASIATISNLAPWRGRVTAVQTGETTVWAVADNGVTSNSAQLEVLQPGLCEDPSPVQCGHYDEYTTTWRKFDQYDCIEGGKGKEHFHVLQLDSAYLVTIAVDPDDSLFFRWDAMLIIMPEQGGDCDPTATVACVDVQGSGSDEIFTGVLQPGRYYLVVDGYNSSSYGDYRLEVSCDEIGTLDSISVSPQGSSIEAGDELQLTATAHYSSGDQINVTEDAFWESSAPRVANISNLPDSRGLARGVDAGATTITASFDGITSDPVGLQVTATPCDLWGVVNCGDAFSDNTENGSFGMMNYSCTFADGQELIYQFALEHDAQVTITVDNFTVGFGGLALILMPAHCNPNKSIACAEGFTGPAQLDLGLAAGTYHVVVDGQTAMDYGAFDMSISCQEVQCCDPACPGGQYCNWECRCVPE